MEDADAASMPVREPAVDRRPVLVEGDEVLVPILLHQLGDSVEREIPGDFLEFARARRAIFRDFEAAWRMDDVEQRRSLGAQCAAIDRMVRIALDVNDVGYRILGAIAERIDQDAAGDGAIGARVARLGRRRQLERPHRCGQSLTHPAEAKSAQARCGQSRGSDLDETATTELHGELSRHCGALFAQPTSKRRSIISLARKDAPVKTG